MKWCKHVILEHSLVFASLNKTVESSDHYRYFTVGKLPVNLKLYIPGKSFPIPGKYRKFYKMYSYEI